MKSKKSSRPRLAQKPLTIALTSALLASGANALENPTATLAPVTVTAAPIVEDNQIDKFSAATTRVTDAQIRDLGALSLPDALKMTPGVQVSLYETVGNFAGNQGGSVYVRGMGTSRPGSEIKTYLDGLPVYMGLWNHPLMDLLPLNAVKTIEINKGPQPQVSGNNLSAINLQTITPEEAGIHGGGSATVGSHGTRTLQATLTGKLDAADFVLAAGSADSDGYRANGDASLDNAFGKVRFRLNDIWTAGLSLLHVDNEVGDPGDNRFATTSLPIGPYQSNGVGRNKSGTDMLTAFVAHKNATCSGDLKIYSNRGKNDLVNDANWGTFKSHFEMSGARWKETFSPWAGGTVVAGIDVDRMSGTITGPHVGGVVGTPFAFGTAGSADVPTFRITSPHVGVSHKFDIGSNWVLQPSLGVRTYKSNIYSSKSSPNAGVSLIGKDLTVYANYSEGILYPGAETYALPRALPMAFAANNGWNTLSPEKDKHTEVGFQWDATATTRLDVSAFQDKVSDRYIWSGFTPFATSVWSNSAADYRLRGAEASLRQDIGKDWVLFAGITALSISLNAVPFVPKTAYSLGANGTAGPFRIAFDAQHQTSMYSQSWDRSVTVVNAKVGAFTVANVRVSYPMPSLGKKGEVFVAGNNLFDETYQYNAGYPMPDRNVRLGISASF